MTGGFLLQKEYAATDVSGCLSGSGLNESPDTFESGKMGPFGRKIISLSQGLDKILTSY